MKRSHNGETRPDNKMGHYNKRFNDLHAQRISDMFGHRFSATSVQLKTLKKRAAKKRRQRD